MRLGAQSLRRTDIGRQHVEACLAKRERFIAAFWHGRLLMMPFALAEIDAAILISQHRDGEYISRIAEHLGLVVVRGSATRGGARAFKQLLLGLREGRHVGITPDGPKGPPHLAKSGVIELARLSGMPILPVAFGAWPRTLLGSWDRFLIPHPFGRGVYVWGEPIYVPADADKPTVARLQARLAERLDALVTMADDYAAGT